MNEENIEYGKLAKYYDIFYKNKNYYQETSFLKNILGDRKSVLDAGCGTGNHLEILEKSGFIVDGFDLNEEMLLIAKDKIKGNLYLGNILNFNNNKKYDAIISMYAVFNHLNDYGEFEKATHNLLGLLNKNGILIIDLHNGRDNGVKKDNVNNYIRVMTWKFNEVENKEYTNIQYKIDNKTYNTNHVFMIYSLERIKELLNKNKWKWDIFENYTMNQASTNSKNIQIVIYKD